MLKYRSLFTPLKVNSLVLKNRIIAAPMGGGFIAAHKMEDLAAKARGGAALVVLGSCNVDNDRSFIARGWPGMFEPHMEMYMDQLNIIHMYGAKASVELLHAGLWADVAPDKHPIGPIRMIRNIGKDADGVQVDAMDEDDMKAVADSYALTALKAKKMGYDMCMLHFAHGWLPAQFLSPKYNKRTDQYGGNFENRIRFPMMIVDKVREAVGPHFPLDMRIGGDEHCEDGIDLEEVIRFLQLIEEKIDMVQVSSGIDKYYDLTTHVEPPNLYPHLYNLNLGEAVKKAISIPVVTVGGITMPDEAEKVVAEGRVDGVAMARALLADPQWPHKAETGQEHDIVPCLRCNSCYHVATGGITHGCSVNPVFGRRDRIEMDRLHEISKKKVVVVGGGPAGMKAALTAVERGHEVHLFEKEKELGGLINVSEYEGRKVDLRNYRRYLVNRVVNSDIVMHLHTEATPEKVEALVPDELIVAVGSVPVKPPIKGVDLPNVIQAVDAYQIIPQIGKTVVIIGGGEIGCEMGLHLAESGRETVIVEMTDQLAPHANLLYKAALNILMKKQDKLSWKMETSCTEITEKGVTIINKNGDESFIEADTVILATGMKPLRQLAEAFSGIVSDVKIIGDCVRPGNVSDATYGGFFAATSIK